MIFAGALKDAFIAHYPGGNCNRKRITPLHAERFKDTHGWKQAAEHSSKPGHGVLIYTDRHVAAYKDGVVEDYTNGRSFQVVEVWYVEPDHQS